MPSCVLEIFALKQCPKSNNFRNMEFVTDYKLKKAELKMECGIQNLWLVDWNLEFRKYLCLDWIGIWMWNWNIKISRYIDWKSLLLLANKSCCYATSNTLRRTNVLRNSNISKIFTLLNEKTISLYHWGRISYIPIPLFRQLGMSNSPPEFIDLDCGMWNA